MARTSHRPHPRPLPHRRPGRARRRRPTPARPGGPTSSVNPSSPGTTSHLNLTLSSASHDGFTVSTLLTDNNSESGDESASAADGIQLVDGQNAKLYLVASDGKGHCLCTQGLTGVVLKDGAPSIISATSAAPPADVTTVDVVVPSFGTVKDVPVQ